ncbi:MAG: response regulator [Castellaniella sp.]|uniref:response regulator n=1 Tax=Castellaniella sp. TaxID=1955812 RepID=UPI003C71206F
MNMSEAIIHVVDDDASVRHACRYMLETVGMVCRDWPDGRVFLERADLYAAGVVLLDMRMPHCGTAAPYRPTWLNWAVPCRSSS